MTWSDVGGWIKNNAGTGAALVGSLLTGNVPGAVAAGVSLVSTATGTTNPSAALEALHGNPETILKLKELALKNEDEIRKHIQEMTRLKLEDKQKEHSTQQETIKEGDKASDEYVRHTRPMMARQSWWGGAIYIFVMEILKSCGLGDGADVYLAGVILSPAMAYMGFRTWDKIKGKSQLVK
jgi:hypothetical protein